MNLEIPREHILSPQEQFASRRRLNALFYSHREKPEVRRRWVSPKAKREFTENPDAPRCAWPGDPDAIRRYFISVRQIARVVADHHGLSQDDLYGHSRTLARVRARQITMYLTRTITKRSYPEIGRRLGGRDHSTAIHGVRKIEQKIAQDSAFAAEIESLRYIIEGSAASNT